MSAPVWQGGTVCGRCGSVIRPAGPGHELDSISHGVCTACLPAYRAELGLAPDRTRDIVFDKAASLGFQAMCAEAEALSSLASFKVGLRLAYDYLLIHDMRGRRR
jgi:hypothetical protein